MVDTIMGEQNLDGGRILSRGQLNGREKTDVGRGFVALQQLHRHHWHSDDRVDLRTLQMPTTAVPICLYKLEVLNPKQKYQMSCINLRWDRVPSYSMMKKVTSIIDGISSLADNAASVTPWRAQD